MIPLFKVNMGEIARIPVDRVLMSGFVGQGPEVEAFEQELEAIIPPGMKALATNSCTSAIEMVLTWLGVGPGDEVITTPLTCVATNAPIVHLGARPVWADVDQFTGLIDPADVARKITSRTKAIIAVDWTGRQADYAALKGHGLPVIQDAAHGPIFDWDNPITGDFVCLSFGPIKHLCAVDGGAVLMRDAEALEEMRLYRWYGLDRRSSADFRCEQNIALPGMKWHMNDLNAAIGRANLRNLQNSMWRHRRNAYALHEGLRHTAPLINTPFDTRSNQWVYPVLFYHSHQREDFKRYMEENGVMVSQVHARNDKHAAYEFPSGPLPGLDFFDTRQANIPCGWWLREADVAKIVDLVRNFGRAL